LRATSETRAGRQRPRAPALWRAGAARADRVRNRPPREPFRGQGARASPAARAIDHADAHFDHVRTVRVGAFVGVRRL